MNRKRRQEAKKKRRERENRAARQRRVESLHCKTLVMEADAAWYGGGDVEAAWRLLEKAVRIYPSSQEARERLAELHIRCNRFLEGLSQYEQLARPPEWPALTYMAALAAYRLRRFDQALTLARLSVRATGRIPELQPLRTSAKQLVDICKPSTRATRKAGSGSVAPGVRGQAQPHGTPGDRDGQPHFDFGAAAPVAAAHSQLAATPVTPSRQTRRSTVVLEPQANGARRAPPPQRAGVRVGDPGAAALGTPDRGARGVRGRSVAGVGPRAIDGGARPEPTVLPDARLPVFPAVSLPELAVQFEVDGPSLSDIEGRIGPAIDVLLRRDYVALRLQKGFDELISLGAVRGLEHFWYQLETVRRLLRDFRGRVLLADEVGLGKTIEASLALKEYWVRGLVRKALILTPPSLVSQWVDELTSKFGLIPAVAEAGKTAPDDALWVRQPLVVASLPLVRQAAYRTCLTAIEYDLVIVDEAHVLKNRASAAWQLVNELKKRFLFLLSATPVGNDLSELYNLILLLKPGLLKTEAQFRRDFGGVAALEQAERRERLRALLREVMIRNTRAHIDVKLPRRLAATEVVSPTGVEVELHEHLSSFIRARYADAAMTDRWRLMMLQMQASSSPAALRAGLDRHKDSQPGDGPAQVREIIERIDQPAKTAALIDLLRRSDEKKIVFTRFHATLDHLRRALGDAGFHVETFHGRLTPAEKGRAIEQFEHHAEILLSSEVGGEGRNLQFCRTVINYDLPWNPMQLEQRIGRVHRIGQTREVFVFNFCLAGSLEDHILKVLHQKLNLFELVAGEIEMILGEFDPEREFAGVVMDLWARSATIGERESAFDRLADELIAARGRYEKTQEIDRALFREEFEV